MTRQDRLVDDLRRAGAANALLPDASGAAETVAGFDTSIRYAPDAVVRARSRGDVAGAVEVAGRHGLPIAVVGTGHGMLGDVAGGILVSTHELAGVEVDPAGRTARVGAGTTWQQVLDAVTPHGLAALCGSSTPVGVIGYLLGGGLGPLARTYGPSADHVRSFEIVTPADGPTTVTADQQPELFWALRGGRGGFGIVTGVTIDLLPLAELHAGGLYLPADAARDVLGVLAEWAPRLSTSITVSVAMLRLPDVPALPAPVRGRFVMHVRFASPEDTAEAARFLGEIRRLAPPLLDTVGAMPYAEIGAVHADPTLPMPVMAGGATLTTVDDDVVSALLEADGPRRDVPVTAVELRLLGGAVARPPTVPNAMGARDAAWNLFVAGSPLGQGASRPHVRSVLEAIAPWRGPHNLINFVGRANDPADVRRSWSSDQNARLDAVRAAVDPDGIVPLAELTRVER